MTVVTIIPVKPFNQAKTRLAEVLSSTERVNLARRLLARTILLARQVGEVVVISGDSAARRQAKRAGAYALVEAGSGLNGAVRQAVEWIIARGGATALILPSDLPLLTAADVHALVELAGPAPAMVITPCHRQEGTNALLLSPPALIAPAFGPGSFRRHMQAGRAAGVEPVIYRADTVAFDLDLPEDLVALRQIQPAIVAPSPTSV